MPNCKTRGTVNKRWKITSAGSGDVLVSTIMQEAKEVPISAMMTIPKLKANIQEAWDVPPEAQFLSFTDGFEPVSDYCDPEMPLWALNIRDGTKLSVAMVSGPTAPSSLTPADTWALHNYTSFTPGNLSVQKAFWKRVTMVPLVIFAACSGVYAGEIGYRIGSHRVASDRMQVIGAGLAWAVLVPAIVLWYEHQGAENKVLGKSLGNLVYKNKNWPRIVFVLLVMTMMVESMSLVSILPTFACAMC